MLNKIQANNFLLEKSQDAKEIFFLLLSHHGPFQMVAEYLYQALVFRVSNDKKSSKILLDLALSKMAQIKKLEKLLVDLGCGREIACTLPTNVCEFKNANKNEILAKIMIEDLAREIVSVMEYEKVIKRLKMEMAKNFIGNIIEEELECVKALEERTERLMKKRVF